MNDTKGAKMIKKASKTPCFQHKKNMVFGWQRYGLPHEKHIFVTYKANFAEYSKKYCQLLPYFN